MSVLYDFMPLPSKTMPWMCASCPMITLPAPNTETLPDS